MSNPSRFDSSFAGEQEVNEEQERRRRVIEQSRTFVVNFGALLRQLRIHAADNRSVTNQLQSTLVSFKALKQDNPIITIVFAEGHTFLNGVWVRATRLMWEHSVAITELMERVGARGVVFEEGFGVASLANFAQALLHAHEFPRKSDEPPDLGVPYVKLIPAGEAEEIHAGRGAFRQRALQIVNEGVSLYNGGQTPRLDLSTRRRQSSVVQNLIRLAEESTEDLLALTTIRDPMAPEATHALMVTVYAIAIGKLMGLRRRDLMRLGAIALNHNIGETLIDRTPASQPRDLTPQERQYIQAHPLMGMTHLLRSYGFKAGMVARAVVNAEHHITWKGDNGYPFPIPRQPHPFSRIVAICDTFNALLSNRPHREAYPPDQALKLTIRSADSKLDPVLVRVLMGLVGRYPAGTVVELDTGEWGVVVGPGRGATPLKRPRVLIITDEDGFEVPEFQLVDLGERHKRRKAWLRTILRTQNPKNLEMTVSAYLLADRVEIPPAKLDIEELDQKKARKAVRGTPMG